MSKIDNKIGPKIKAFRRQLGMQANKLAEELGISPSYLNLIENGKRKIDGDLLLKVCEKLRIELSDLTSKADINLENNKLGETASLIRDKQIPLEICITSNIHTNMYKSYETHPIKDLVDLGFNISLNTDNRLMSNTDIVKEMNICKDIGIKNPENLLETSASYSFLN